MGYSNGKFSLLSEPRERDERERKRTRARVNWVQGLARTRHVTSAATSAHDRCCTHTYTQCTHTCKHTRACIRSRSRCSHSLLLFSLSAGPEQPSCARLSLVPLATFCSLCVCVPYVPAHYYYYFYLYFTFCCCCCRCCKHVKYFLFVCRRLSTLNPQIVYVFRCVCVRVFVCAGGSSCYGHVLPPSLSPAAIAIAALNKHKLSQSPLCVVYCRRLSRVLLPLPLLPLPPLRLSSFTFLFFAQLKCLSNYLDVFPPASCVNWLTLSSQKRKGETKNDLIYR